MSQKLTCHLTDELSGENYKQFLKFAFEYSDYFSISTFKHIRKKDLLDSYYDFLSKVQPYEVDTYKFKQLMFLLLENNKYYDMVYKNTFSTNTFNLGQKEFFKDICVNKNGSIIKYGFSPVSKSDSLKNNNKQTRIIRT